MASKPIYYITANAARNDMQSLGTSMSISLYAHPLTEERLRERLAFGETHVNLITNKLYEGTYRHKALTIKIISISEAMDLLEE